MAYKRTYQQYYADIAKAIRNKGGTGTYMPIQMAAAINDLPVKGIGTITTFPSSGGYRNYAMTNPRYYTAIANAIRDKAGTTTKYKPSQMAAAINALIKGVIIKFKYGATNGGMTNLRAENRDTGEVVYYSSVHDGILVSPGRWTLRATLPGTGEIFNNITIPEGTEDEWVEPFPWDS